MTMWGGIGMIWLLALIGWGMRRIQQERQILRMASQSGIVIGLLAGLAAGIAHGQVDAFGTLADIAGWNWLALAFGERWCEDGEISKQKRLDFTNAKSSPLLSITSVRSVAKLHERFPPPTMHRYPLLDMDSNIQIRSGEQRQNLLDKQLTRLPDHSAVYHPGTALPTQVLPATREHRSPATVLCCRR
jgi:hypothetical protein